MAWLAWVWFAATFVPLIWRKHFPIAVIAVTGVSTWIYYLTGHWGPLIAAPAIAVLSLRRTRRVEQRSRQVEEERLRIAREVHDVVAHSLAMINVQAGVAAHVADRRPEEAVKALRAIKEASGHALDDLRATLGVLRAGTTPVPGLERLQELVAPVPKARVVGAPGALPASVDAAAYRVVQEALTNAMRYAPDASEIVISFEHTEDALVLTVADDGSGAGSGDRPPQGAGTGIRGMRERVAALGGTLEAGPSDNGFTVRAVLPWEVRGDQGGAGRRPGARPRGFPPAARHRGRLRGRRRGR